MHRFNAARVPTIEIPPISEIDRTNVSVYREEFKNGKVKRRYEARKEDGSRVRHGNFVEFYPSEKKFIAGMYRNGAPHGEWTYFHENGTVAKQGIFVDGQLYGKWTIKRDDGVLVREDNYLGGSAHGLEVVYFGDGKSRMYERLHINGKPEGTWMAWYNESRMLFKIDFKDGKRHGEMVQWYPNGIVQSTGTYQDNKKHGLFKAYSQKGELVQEMQWENDKRVKIGGPNS